MEKIFILIALFAMLFLNVNCSTESCQAVPAGNPSNNSSKFIMETGNTSIYEINFKGHTYIVVTGYKRGSSIIHAEHCKCKY